MADILLTESIQHSLHVAKNPLFALYLDAKSAFDNVFREFLIRNLFLCGTTEASTMFINTRLESRQTIVDWDKQHLGPIHDQKGVEQGGINSGDYYKIFGKPQLDLAQRSGLGVELPGSKNVPSIGQADDTILTSNNIHALQCLLQLTLHFCQKYNVELCVEKTKLQAFATPDLLAAVEHIKSTSPININGKKIEFVSSSVQGGAEHVGIIRSETGNFPHILSRLASHKKSMGAVMHTGIGRGHRGNPAASLKLQQLYGIPVLLSGLGALVLKKTETDVIDHHLNLTTQNLMRLHDKTPRSVTAFLAGRLPGTALVHLRLLSNFGMIARNPSSILHKLGLEFFSHKLASKSWFSQIRDICLLYQLPHPLSFMLSHQTKESFKSAVKNKVISYWEAKLRLEASGLTSLKYFHPENMSLSSPHPLWLTASSPYEVSKATVQAQMLSGRYRTELLCSHWSTNTNGWCLTPSCTGLNVKEDLEHILVYCPSLAITRKNLLSFTLKYARANPILYPILSVYCNPRHPQFCQFLLDCTCFADVMAISSLYGSTLLNKLLYIGRTWCYSLHRNRARLLDRWEFS